MGLWNAIKERVFRISDTPQIVAGMAAGGAIMPVSPDRALYLSTVFACVRLLSETVGTLPCMVYKRLDGQGKEPARAHNLYYVLHDSPNADNTSVEYFERVVADLCLRGNHFSEIGRNAKGEVISLTPLHPDAVDAYRGTDGIIHYYYADRVNGWREIPQEFMFHVRGFGTTSDDVLGLSPISYARVSLDIAFSTDEAAARTYSGGMRHSGILSTEKVLSPEQRQQEREWASRMAAGTNNTSGLLVLGAGYKYTPISVSPHDAQMLENRLFNVEDICRWFRVAPYLVGHTEKSTSWGTGLEQQNLGFVTYTLRPYLSRIESAISKWLIPLKEQNTYLAEFNLEGLLRADTQGRSNFYSTALQNGWMNRDDVRSKENLPPIPGGETFTVQSNLIPLNQLGQEKGNADNAN